MWLGLQSQDAGDYRRARALLGESLAVRRRVGDRSVGFVLGFLSRLARLEGDAAGARRYAEEMLGYFREDGDPLGLAVALDNLGELAESEGDYPTARAYLADALTRRRDIGDRRGIAFALWSSGKLACLEGDFARAEALLQEALGIFREVGAREIGSALASLGDVARLQGDLGGAVGHLRESLALLSADGQRRDVCRSLYLLGVVAIEQGAPGRALRLFAASTANAPAGPLLEPAERRRYDDAVAAARAALGHEAFAAAWAQGQALTLEQAISYALEEDGA
jgi:tetratricopeptide (TPR) repeat protein